MGIYLLHVCEGERILADAGHVDVAQSSAAVAAGVLLAKELARDLRFALSAVVVTDATSKVLARVPIWDLARAREPEEDGSSPSSSSWSDSPRIEG